MSTPCVLWEARSIDSFREGLLLARVIGRQVVVVAFCARPSSCLALSPLAGGKPAMTPNLCTLYLIPSHHKTFLRAGLNLRIPPSWFIPENLSGKSKPCDNQKESNIFFLVPHSQPLVMNRIGNYDDE